MAAYYARRIRWGPAVSEEFWQVDECELSRIDVVSGSGISVFPREAGESVSSILERAAPHGEWYKLQNRPGEYYARMARPTGINEEGPGRNPDLSDEFRYYRARSAGQLYAFIQELDDICRVVHPEASNLLAFGHAIRNILILACTEVEAHWKVVLEDNKYKSATKGDRFNTNDYVKLLPAMYLDQYVVNLNFYPWLPTISPFAGWSHRTPTASLPWYQAYNQVKHDREKHFARATLSHALTAVAACFVMLCAQYGWDFAKQGEDGARAFFKLIKGPNWEPAEVYVPPFGESYKVRNYPFPA